MTHTVIVFVVVFSSLVLLAAPDTRTYPNIYYPVPEDNCTQERDCTCGGCPPYQPETGGCDKRGG